MFKFIEVAKVRNVFWMKYIDILMFLCDDYCDCDRRVFNFLQDISPVITLSLLIKGVFLLIKYFEESFKNEHFDVDRM